MERKGPKRSQLVNRVTLLYKFVSKSFSKKWRDNEYARRTASEKKKKKLNEIITILTIAVFSEDR